MRLLEGLAGSVVEAAVWLDYLEYVRRLFLRGAGIPWLNPVEFAALDRQARTLLRPAVAGVRIERFFDAWLSARPETLRAMAAGRRPIAALKALLADREAVRALVEVISNLAPTDRSTPLALALPSPSRWALLARTAATGIAEATLADDDVDGAAAYVADFLRAFSGLPVAGIVLEETRGVPLTPDFLELYRPVLNAARHYRWDVGLFAIGATAPPGMGFDFWIGDVSVSPSVVNGIVVPLAFWSGAPPPALASCAFYYAEIPAEAGPESVLERLESLRATPRSQSN